LLQEYSHLGIPHFQRGLVWERQSIALLLESLYKATPCGSILLWEPPDAGQGIPLGRQTAELLIIDGQQRIRSLWDVFGEAPLNTDDGDKACWCLNLGRLPETAGEFGGGRRFDLFRFVKDPREQFDKQQHMKRIAAAQEAARRALVPLRWFLDARDDAELEALIERDDNRPLADAVDALLRSPSIRRSLHSMLEEPLFHIAVLRSERALAEVVDIYNRINTAGKRVEAEERTFANLIAVHPAGGEAVRVFLDDDHAPGPSVLTERDRALERQRENLFGFKLFMRVFMIVLAYHRKEIRGGSSFSFETADRETLADPGVQKVLPEILQITREVLEDTRSILRGPLCCDDFRFLPDTSSLWPIFVLLTRFRGLVRSRVAPSGALGSMALRLVAADLPKRDLLALCRDIDRSTSLADVRAIFDEHRDLAARSIKPIIDRGIANAESLMDRFTLMLYWLLRSRAARDFSYDKNLDEKCREFRRRTGWASEQPICAQAAMQPALEVCAEKQHIFPYSWLKDVYKLEDGPRPGSHAVNDIGNLTYLSSELNGLDGIGQRPLSIAEENSENRISHFLTDDAVDVYERAIHKYGNPTDSTRDAARRAYERFCRKRRASIAEALVAWERSLAAQPMSVDVKPARRIINPTGAEQLMARIADLGYPADVANLLSNLVTELGFSQSGGKTADKLPIEHNPSGRKQLLRLNLYRHPNRIKVTFRDAQFAAQFQAKFARVPLDRDKRVRSAGPLENMEDIADILRWIESEIRATSSIET
jgi:hypothetical protein